MAQASRDENRIPTLLGVSSADGTTPVPLFADPTTHRLYVDLAAGGTATVDAGTTTTLAPGASATVVNSGTTTDAVFDFGIPAGEKGDPGDPGPTGPVGMVWKDAYVGATAYVVNDAVSYNGSSYICILNSTGNLPTDTTYWSLVAQKGSDGLGTGDMLASVYDPTNVADDAFDMDNMAEGTNNKLVSAAEKSGWSGKQDALGFTPEDVVNKSTNIITDAASNTKYPGVKAIKDYADGLVAGLLDYRGGYDASSGDYPITGGSGTAGDVMKGDMWVISVAGTIGGEDIQVGDSIIANIDTPGQTASNWNHLNANISYVPEDVANKKTAMTGNTTSDTFYLTAKAIYDWATGLFQTLGNLRTSFQATPDDTHYPSEKLVKESLDAKANANNVLALDNTTAFTPDNDYEPATKKYVDSETKTLTNTRITPRITTITSHATPTINTDDCDAVTITAQAEDITSMTTNLSGTPTNFQKLIIRIKDNGTAIAITWGDSFEAKGVALPNTTVISKVLTVGFIYDTVTSKWGCVAVAQEA